MKPLRVVIAGAGAAGILLAAALKRNLIKSESVEVTIVYDPNTPHIGVGESIGFNARAFFEEVLQLREEQWIVKSRSTQKHGVVHSGFNGSTEPVYFSNYDNPWWFQAMPGIGSDKDYTLVQVWNHLYLKGLRSRNDMEGDLSDMHWFNYFKTMPKPGVVRRSAGSYHFNADYIKDVVKDLVCIPFGVKIIPSKIDDVILNDGKITSLITGNGIVEGDLFVDCTGFARLLAKKCDFKWVDLPDHFNNRAILGQGANLYGSKHPITNMTEHHAMENGWCFSVPMAGRCGSGYIFNTRMCKVDEQQLIEEFNHKFPWKANSIGRVIHWDPGYYENTFVSNCITLGISSMFIDAYDSNAFSTQLRCITSILRALQQDTSTDFAWRDDYNRATNHVVDDTIFRIEQAWTAAPKDDTPYWQEMGRIGRSNRIHERIQETVWDEARVKQLAVHPRPPTKFWFQSAIYSQMMHYNIQAPDRISMSDKQERRAVEYFQQHSDMMKALAQAATPIAKYYEEIYE